MTTDCHDAFSADGSYGSTPRCYTGTVIVGASTGLQYKFQRRATGRDDKLALIRQEKQRCTCPTEQRREKKYAWKKRIGGVDPGRRGRLGVPRVAMRLRLSRRGSFLLSSRPNGKRSIGRMLRRTDIAPHRAHVAMKTCRFRIARPAGSKLAKACGV